MVRTYTARDRKLAGLLKRGLGPVEKQARREIGTIIAVAMCASYVMCLAISQLPR